jgi:hypothetical protein
MFLGVLCFLFFAAVGVANSTCVLCGVFRLVCSFGVRQMSCSSARCEGCVIHGIGCSQVVECAITYSPLLVGGLVAPISRNRCALSVYCVRDL